MEAEHIRVARSKAYAPAPPDRLASTPPTHNAPPLSHSRADGAAQQGKAWYSITVTTSDLRGSGTGADVWASLAGSAGRSELAPLPCGPNAFAQGRRDVFRCGMILGQLGFRLSLLRLNMCFCVLEGVLLALQPSCTPGTICCHFNPTPRLHLPRLGELRQITLGLGGTQQNHGGCGASGRGGGVGADAPSWHLARAEVVDEATGRTWHFVGGWGGFTRSQGNG